MFWNSSGSRRLRENQLRGKRPIIRNFVDDMWKLDKKKKTDPITK